LLSGSHLVGSAVGVPVGLAVLGAAVLGIGVGEGVADAIEGVGVDGEGVLGVDVVGDSVGLHANASSSDQTYLQFFSAHSLGRNFMLPTV
jgi:hypothetical protein